MCKKREKRRNLVKLGFKDIGRTLQDATVVVLLKSTVESWGSEIQSLHKEQQNCSLTAH